MSGDWLKDFLDVMMFAVPKKTQAEKCTKPLVWFHTTGWMLHLFINMLESKIEKVMDDQFGVLKGKDSRDLLDK